MKSFLFLDTNIYLHFEHFDQIKWKELLNVTDDIIIVIPSVIISELDNHKYNKNDRIASQAKTIIKLLDKYSEGKTTKSLDVLFHSHECNQLIMQQNQLDNTIQDDRLLAVILEFNSKALGNVVLVSNDLGIKLKAKNFGIDILILPDNYQLKIDMNSTEKKIKELEKENILLKNKIPDLKIYFDNKESYKKYSLKRQEKNVKEIKDVMKGLRDKLTHKSLEKESFGGNDLVFGAIIDNIQYRKEFIERYNKDLDEYFIEYEKYLININNYNKVNSRSYLISLILVNEGTVPANDIHINFHIPDGMDILDSKDFPRLPEIPEVPVLRSMFDIFNNSLSMPSAFNYRTIMPQNLNIPNISGLKIKKTNSYDIDLHVKRLMHQMQENLKEFYVLFSIHNKAFSFEFDYSIIAENIPNKINNQLKFVIES